MKEDITKNDLTLMMQSYENMILMHKTVLDQQSEMTDLLYKVVENQNQISQKQMSTCSSLEGITKQLDDCSEKLSKSRDKIESTSTTLTDKLATHDKESIKEHSKIKNRVYIAYGLSGTIILGVLGLLWRFSSVLDVLMKSGGQ